MKNTPPQPDLMKRKLLTLLTSLPLLTACEAGGVAPAAAGGGLGSGIMGGLATGECLVPAWWGEALAHNFMDGDRNAADIMAPPVDPLNTASDDMGGADFGIAHTHGQNFVHRNLAIVTENNWYAYLTSQNDLTSQSEWL